MVAKDLIQYLGDTKKAMVKAVASKVAVLMINILFAFTLSGFLVKLFLAWDDLSRESSVGLFLERFFVAFPYVLPTLLGLIILRVVLQRWTATLQHHIVYEAKVGLRGALFQKVQSLGMGYKNALSTSSLVHQMGEGVEQLENYYGGYLTQFYYCMGAPLVLFLVMAPFHWGIAALFSVMAFFIPWALHGMLGKIKKVQKGYWKKYGDVSEVFFNNIEGLTTLKVFQAHERKAREMDDEAEAFRIETMMLLKNQLRSIAVIDWIAYGGIAMGILWGTRAYTSGQVSLFGMVLILLLSAEFFVPMRALTSLFHVAMTGVAAKDTMEQFMAVDGQKKMGGKTLMLEKKLQVTGVTFSYDGQKKVLKNIDLEIPAKGLTALTGPSGCGKSTFTEILTGSLTKTQGEIKVDDLAIEEISGASLRQEVLRLGHDGHLFQGTVAENLAMGNREATEEELWAVLEKVSLASFFKKKGGLATPLVSKGQNLSGGQVQRLALARALLKNASLYIFDEATSNVDVESEEIILKVMEDLANEKAVLLISHRRHPLKRADNIYYMDQGTIIEAGSHETLYAMNGAYKRLCQEEENLLLSLEEESHENNVIA